MNYTDHNLYDPFKSNKYLLRDEVKNAIYLFQAEYDAIGIKDPKCFYIIKDRPVIYRGKDEIVTPSYKHKIAGKYFVSNNDQDEFVVYLNYETCDQIQYLIEVERYKDSSRAINAMLSYNNANSHCRQTILLFEVIKNLIEKKITLLNFIYEVIVIFGYKNHTEFQNLLNSIRFYWTPNDFNHNKIPKTILMREQELINSKNFLFRKFFAIYHIIASYDFFKKKLSISKEEIMNIIEKIYLIF